jgi:hypothetical protein
MIVTVAVVAVLVLASAAVAIFLLIKDSSDNTAGGQTTGAKPGPAVPTGASQPGRADPAAPARGGGGGGGGGGEAEIVRVAEAYAEAVNARKESTAKELTCDKTDPGDLYHSTTSGQEVAVTSRPEISGSDSAFVAFGVSTSGTEPIDIPILLKNHGGWCIAI